MENAYLVRISCLHLDRWHTFLVGLAPASCWPWPSLSLCLCCIQKLTQKSLAPSGGESSPWVGVMLEGVERDEGAPEEDEDELVALSSHPRILNGTLVSLRGVEWGAG